jgi:hypothetical protein
VADSELHAGQERSFHSFLATDWDGRIVTSNGLSMIHEYSDPCSYTWQVWDSAGNVVGSFSGGINGGQSVVWVAPQTPGTYRVTLVIDDQNAANQPANQLGSRNDAHRGFNEEPLRFKTTITVVP